MTTRYLIGDCRDVLKTLPDESVHCVVTSPPYWGLRDYGTATWDGGDAGCDHSPEKRGGRFATPVSSKQGSNTGSGTASHRDCPCGARRIDSQLGLEPDFNSYIAEMVGVFREVRRVLRSDGTLWLNLGDSYSNYRTHGGGAMPGQTVHNGELRNKPSNMGNLADDDDYRVNNPRRANKQPGLKEKDLCGIPWRVAFALQADGWWLRQDIIWSKPNPMPESVTDRCTKAHEYLFLMSKSARYYYDAQAIREEAEYGRREQPADTWDRCGVTAGKVQGATRGADPAAGRNKRSVWEVATAPFSEAHFATFPPALIEPCVKAGTSEKGCCAKCGAPWMRDIKTKAPDGREAINGQPIDGGRPLIGDNMIDAGVRGPFNAKRGVLAKQTLGWSPSCPCNAGAVHCTVLDPFGGAGTTGLVADRLQRNAILIELNPEYAAMAQRRVTDDAPLFAHLTN